MIERIEHGGLTLRAFEAERAQVGEVENKPMVNSHAPRKYIPA